VKDILRLTARLFAPGLPSLARYSASAPMRGRETGSWSPARQPAPSVDAAVPGREIVMAPEPHVVVLLGEGSTVGAGYDRYHPRTELLQEPGVHYLLQNGRYPALKWGVIVLRLARWKTS
jgi:hypothetical protein